MMRGGRSSANDSQVLRPTDLRNVCLVNKECHELAVKPLYRYIDLDIGSHHDGRLATCFSPRNIGVPHIRSIHLYLADEQHDRDKRNTVDQAHLVTRMILELLPADILERFSWCPWKAFKVDNLLLLYRRQRKLKNLEVIRLDKDFTPMLEKDEKLQESIFRAGKRLFLYPEDRASIALSGLFVKRAAAQLEELTIHANFREGHDPFEELVGGGPEYIDPRVLNDSAREPGLLTRTVFAHQMPFDKCEQFAHLTSLSLHRVSVRQAADTWCRVIDFTKIEYLHLHQCTGADALLGQLCKAANLPKLLKAFSLQHVDNQENETLLAVDGFLCLVSGIRDLVIDLIGAKDLPAAAGIARHSKTLETLNVHSWREGESVRLTPPPPPPASTPLGEELVYKQRDLDTICSACKKITQLSLAWPAHSIVKPLSGETQVFEFTIISQLRHLVTLNISSWPSNATGGASLPRSVYETLLQAAALRVFNLAAFWAPQPALELNSPVPIPVSLPAEWRFDTRSTPKLRLVAFGVSDKIYERLESKAQTIYLRSTCRDAEGRTKLHAAPIGWCLKQFVEPVSDVLNTSLLRSAKPPFSVMTARERGLSWDPEDEDIVDD